MTILTRLVGPAQIVRDPTDLVALAALWPAWRLWRRLESAPPEPPGRRAVVALALASLATMATSCAPVVVVERLMVFENRLYAGLARDRYGNLDSPIVQSDDKGKTWQYIMLEKAPPKVVEELQQSIALPVTACAPQSPQICYRISGPEIVEGSLDGGQTWDVVWQIPPGRRKFVERYWNMPPGPCKKGFDFGPYDMTLLPTAEGTVLVVATGSEGVLVRTPDGQWQRRSVLTAEPTPFADSGIGPVLGEIALLLIAALSTWVGTTIVAWNTLMSNSSVPSGGAFSGNGGPTLCGILFSGGLAGLWLSRNDIAMRYGNVILLAIPSVILIGVALSWQRIKRSSPAPALVTRARWVCGLLPLGVLLAGLPFILWVWGIIAFYWIALGLAVVIVLSVLETGARTLRKISTLLNE